MSMEQWWNDTDRENWSIGRKTLYSVCGRRMNEYGGTVEWYWQEKPEVLLEKHFTVSVVDEWMSMGQWWNDTDWETWSTGKKHYTAGVVVDWVSMEEWWNDTDRVELKYWEKNIIQRGW